MTFPLRTPSHPPPPPPPPKKKKKKNSRAPEAQKVQQAMPFLRLHEAIDLCTRVDIVIVVAGAGSGAVVVMVEVVLTVVGLVV